MNQIQRRVIEDLAEESHLISIDSRTIKRGEIFVAIKGKSLDGHDFVNEAFKKGAKLALVSKDTKASLAGRKGMIKVKDTVKVLGDIAKAKRAKFKIPVIAITGSNGKTTAKDMVAHVLSARYNVLKSKNSFNNFIGLPLTIFGLDKKHDVAVLEMGMNYAGEIKRLSEIAAPKIGVVTNIKAAHLEFFGTLGKIFKAKSELLKELKKDALAVLNRDDAYLRDVKGVNCRKIFFGIDNKCAFQAKDVSEKGNKWYFSVGRTGRFELSLLGRHNIYNALIAIMMGRHFNIDFAAIKKKLKSFRHSSARRLEFKDIRGVGIVDDCYNSNPSSLECAIETLIGHDAPGRRIIVSGDMLELGKKAKGLHEAAGRTVARKPVSALITLGKFSRFMNNAASEKENIRRYHADSHNDAARFLRKIAKPGDVVLVKGSRGMQMEKVIESFREDKDA